MKILFTMLVAMCAIFFSVNNSQAQWVQTSGTSGNGISCLAVSGNNIFAGADAYGGNAGGGAYISTDNGTSWTAVNTGLTSVRISSFAVSGTTIFAGTWFTNSGAFISTNNGSNWTAVNNGFKSPPNISTLKMIGENLFAGAGGAYFSANLGANWTAIGLTNYDIRSFVMCPIGSGNLFAATRGKGVFFSTDMGATWVAVNTGLTSTNVLALVTIGTNLFAGTDVGVFLSSNNGTSWTNVTNNLLIENGISCFEVIGTNLFVGTNGAGVSLTTNNGTTWTGINTGLTNMNVFALVANANNLFLGTGDGASVWRRSLSEFGINGVDDYELLPSMVVISPNPTSGISTILNPPENTLRLSVLNILGESIMELTNPHFEHFSIDLSAQPVGVYLVRFVSASGKIIETRKLVIAR